MYIRRLNNMVAIPGGGMVLFSPEFGTIFQFNAMAHLVWRLLPKCTVETIVRLISDRYNVPKSQVAVDIDELSKQFEFVANKKVRTRRFATNNVDGIIEPGMVRVLFKLWQLTIDIEAPPSLAAHFATVFKVYENIDDAPILKVQLSWLSPTSGALSLDGTCFVPDAPWEILVGGVYHGILQRLYPHEEWAAILHAAAVSKHGRALILAATSGSGKTTLTAGLVASGYQYLSDEVVPLRQNDFAVRALPLALRIKRGSVAMLSKQNLGLDPYSTELVQSLSLPADPSGSAIPPLALVFTKYVVQDASGLKPLDVEAALTKLLSDRVFLGHPLNLTNIQNFVSWLKHIKIYELTYSEYKDAEQCLNSVLQS